MIIDLLYDKYKRQYIHAVYGHNLVSTYIPTSKVLTRYDIIPKSIKMYINA